MTVVIFNDPQLQKRISYQNRQNQVFMTPFTKVPFTGRNKNNGPVLFVSCTGPLLFFHPVMVQSNETNFYIILDHYFCFTLYAFANKKS